MKIKDFIFRSPSLGMARNDTLCRVRIFNSNEADSVAIISDVGSKNPGQSVTNSIEYIRKELIKAGHIDEEAIVIEHIEESVMGGMTFDFMSFDEENSPDWKSISLKKLSSLCDTSNEELNSKVSHNEKLSRELDRMRLEICPDIDKPPVEPDDVAKRRSEISKNTIQEKDLLDLINKNSNESELQKLLKKDLSVFGKAYGHIGEYISFSEFPLADGFVDFVVFTGRSRMDVYFIEIKGADFNFLTSDSYRKLSFKIDRGIRQTTKRLYDAKHGNYFGLCNHLHSIKQKVENGDKVYNSLLCPKGHLEVSPEKDVNFHGVVIGGRCKDDLYESNVRQQFEVETPQIRIDSWDSWLKRMSGKIFA